MNRRKLNKKALVIDSSGFDPLQKSIANGFFDEQTVEAFFSSTGIDLYFCKSSTSELSFQPCAQSNLFVETISSSSVMNETIYLSDTGVFSRSSFGLHSLEITPIFIEAPVVCQDSLWQASTHWQKLSEVDKNIISTAKNIERDYGWIAVLTNDWRLRQQCALEGISAYGTSSLLAGMVLSNIFSYQKGTAIYHEWMKRNPKSVPNGSLPGTKMRFGEILQLEKERKSSGKSFW